LVPTAFFFFSSHHRHRRRRRGSTIITGARGGEILLVQVYHFLRVPACVQIIKHNARGGASAGKQQASLFFVLSPPVGRFARRKKCNTLLSDIKKNKILSLLLNQDATLLRARSSLVSLLIELSEKEQTKNVALIAK
jgi:hypothetical protein|tara:strand:+ start:73 stop:483 length:411 start_codon:yes stop_codon:yes gene_type:complete